MTHDDPERPEIAATRAWLERIVIGLNLCPFAKPPHAGGRLRICASDAVDEAALLADLDAELARLLEAPERRLETTLLVHPGVLQEFDAYNQFLDPAEALLAERGAEGVVQLASFHPAYRFADAEADAVENATNRSPFPMLHLLREASVDRAVAAYPEADSIWARNVALLRTLGHDGLRRALAGEDPA